MKTNKRGVSLIVLVITIIIMIIIAGAIILALNGSGMLGRANTAKTKADVSTKKQAGITALAEYNLLVNSNDSSVLGKTASSYVREKLTAQGIDADNVTVVDEKVIVGSGASAINKGVKQGDYVGYVPIAKTSSTYKVGQTDTYFSTQSGSATLGWRYIGIDDNGNALLIADKPTNDGLYLVGKSAYLQGPNIMNELCKELYSSNLGIARNTNVNDINKILEANPVGTYVNVSGRSIDNPLNLTIGQLISQNDERELSDTKTPNVGENINDYVSNSYSYAGTKYKANTTDEYKLVFKNELDENISYWLASSSVLAHFSGGRVFFNLSCVVDGSCTGKSVFNSVGIPYRFYVWN